MSSPTAEGRHPARQPAEGAASIHGRRLSAILHADLTGYVRLMEGAEERTVSHLKSVRAEVWKPVIEAAGGRVVNIVADSVLAEFGSAVAAVTAAIDIQERMARFNGGLDEEQRLMFRIGLHLGEVIVDETETIFGDAVNVAARIQAMAEPGGIAASREIHDTTHSQIDCVFLDGGKHRAKNISRSLQIYHLRTRESASRSLARARAGVMAWRPMLRGTIAATAMLLAGGGYLVFTANPMMSVRTVALALSAEQLEQALAERRKADALAVEKRQLEEEVRQRAEAEAEAKRQADVELENARQARQKAERELAQLKADIEARHRTESGSEDQAAAAAQRADEEAAQRKAEAEAASLREAEQEAAKKAAAGKTAATPPDLQEEAETAERRLRLESTDRQRLQVALTSLGFDTRGDDGVFGPRSREMIARWQRARRQPVTGFVTKAQQQALLKEAAASLSKYDEQRKAEEDARATVEASVASPVSPPPESTDGLWRGTYECGRDGNLIPFTLKPEMHLKGGTGTWYTTSRSWTNDQTFSVSVSIDGTNVRVTRRSDNRAAIPLLGQLEGNSIRASNNACTMMLVREDLTAGAGPWEVHRTAIAPTAAPSTAGSVSQPISAAYNTTYSASRALPSPDGSWRGTYKCNAGWPTNPPFVIDLELQLTNGSARWRSAAPSRVNGNSFDVAVSVIRDLASVVRTGTAHIGARDPLTGRYDGDTINATGREWSANRDCTLALTRS